MSVVERSEDYGLFIGDDDLYFLAKDIHLRHHLNDSVLNKVWSSVKKVRENFAINEKLEIEIPSMKILNEKQIPAEKVQQVVSGGLTHEDGHAFLFPFITQLNLIYAVGKGYCDRIKIPFDHTIFNAINNILSDIINEIILIRNGVLGSGDIPALNKYYVYLPNKKEYDEFIEKRLENEKDPLKALFMQHILVTSGSVRIADDKKYFSELLYSYLWRISDLPLQDPRLVSEELIDCTRGGINFLYESANEMYSILNTLRTDKQNIIETTLTRRIVNAYIILLLAFYRLAIQKQTSLQSLQQANPDVKFPPPPPNEILDEILQSLEGEQLLGEKMLEESAKRILNQALITMKGEWTTVQVGSEEVSVPWYAHPRGKLVQSTLTRGILEWRVKTSRPVFGYKKEMVGGLPKNVTIVIDESASTERFTSILNNITLSSIRIYDAERIVAMSLLYNTLNMGGENVPVNLIRFSNDVIHEKHTIKTAYERFKKIYPMFGSTMIEVAVEEAIKHHKDAPTNYFILLTDMEIYEKQAGEITQKLEKIKQSPLMILIIGEKLPEKLLRLKRKNTAIINVSYEKDLTKIEEAIRTIIR
ncbi:MAG: vWA domain-containing protein [Thermoprotei archaeon]